MTPRLHRIGGRGRRARLFAVLACAILLASACGSSSSDDAGGTPDGGTDPSGGSGADERCAEGSARPDLTMAVFSETRGLDPVMSAGGGVAGGTELSAIFDRLARWDPETGDYEPWVAESFEANADHTEWTVVLRPDVRFGNGDPLTAATVKESMERFSDPQFRSHYANVMQIVTSMTVVDDLTLVFELREPWAGFPYLLAGQTGMVTNPAVVAAMTPEEFNLAPTGAGVGPYDLVRWAPGEAVVVAGRSDYWGGPVCIDELRFVAIANARTAMDALDSGEVDIALLRDPTVVDEARSAGVAGHLSLQNAGEILTLNNDAGPMADQRLRQAVALAVDPELVDARATEGTGLPGSALIHDSSRSSPGVAGPPHDPDRARQLVAEAKADGWDGKVRLLCDQARAEGALASEAMLRDVGFDVVTETVPTPDLIRLVSAEGNFDIACYGFSIAEGVIWPNLDRKVRSSSSAASPRGDRPESDAIIHELLQAATMDEERDVLARYQEAWNEEVPAAVLAAVTEYVAWSEDVEGVVPTFETIVLLGGVHRDG